MSQTDIHAAFGPNYDPSRLDRVKESVVATGFSLPSCDRHKHGRLVRRQRQLAAPPCGRQRDAEG